MEQCSICLEALDGGVVALATCGHRFHAACLAEMAGAVGTATTRRGSLTACPNCRTVSRVALVTSAAFSVGDRVLALWGHKFYPGVVDEVVDGGRAYEIAWDDGDENRVLAKNVRVEAPAAPVIVGQSSAANDGAWATSNVEVLEDDDDRSISSAAFGIESSATSFAASGEGLRAPAPAAAPEEEPAATPRRLVRCGDCKTCRARNGRPCRAPVPGQRLPRKTSRFTGVQPYYNQWRASISVRYKRVDLGYFDEEQDAARAYDAALVKYRGESPVNFPGESPRASVLAALPDVDDADSYDARVIAVASAAATPRHERSLAARRVKPPPAAPESGKGCEMRRVGDAAWRSFGSRRDAAKAFGVSNEDVNTLITDPKAARGKAARLRSSFEVRPARMAPRKKHKPTAPGKGPKKLCVEGATQRQNGKWINPAMFPGRDFDDLDEYRAAKKQRAARREEYRARARENPKGYC